MFSTSLAGGELFDRIAAEDYKMSEAEVINYMIQVCQGLAYMHENSIVHLDIKVSGVWDFYQCLCMIPSMVSPTLKKTIVKYHMK